MRIVVDTDGGVDDVVALAWLLSAPDIEVAAIVATGGARTSEVVGAAIATVLDVLAPVVRPMVVQGADVDAAVRERVPSGAGLHGEFGLGDLRPLRDADFATSPELPDHDGYLTLGPLTTAARLAEHRTWQADTLTIMGGAFSMPGVVDGAEPNFARDPGAARRVLAGPPAGGVRIVPVDATTQATIDEVSAREVLNRAGGSWQGMRAQILRYYWGNAEVYYCHDLVAAVVAARPDVVDIEAPSVVTVDDQGRTRAVDTPSSPVRVVRALSTPTWQSIVRAWK